MKIKYLILLSMVFVCSLKANEQREVKTYGVIEITNNQVSSIGIGYREFIRKHCFDFNFSFNYPYKPYNFKKFYPVSFAINYLYFIKDTNTYLGLGGKYTITLSKNDFTLIEVKPCITLGLLTNIKNNDVFIELKGNFLRFINILSNYINFNYTKEDKDKALKNCYLSVNFGTYF